MSIRDQIAPLEQLSTLDSDIRRIDDQLQKLSGTLEGMRSEVKSLEDRLKSDKETLSSMEKTRSELVVELRQMSSQIERSRERLQRSRNERESNAAQREIEELRKLHRDREEEIDRLASAIEGAKAAIAAAEIKQADLLKELQGSSEGATASLDALDRERKRCDEIRKGLVSQLPAALYRRYESIRQRRPVAIARTHDGTCLGCHMSIPPMMFQKMRRQDAFEICPSCHRILYYMPAEAASSADPSRA